MHKLQTDASAVPVDSQGAAAEQSMHYNTICTTSCTSVKFSMNMDVTLESGSTRSCRVTHLSVSPCSRVLAAVYGNGEVVIWNLEGSLTGNGCRCASAFIPLPALTHTTGRLGIRAAKHLALTGPLSSSMWTRDSSVLILSGSGGALSTLL